MSFNRQIEKSRVLLGQAPSQTYAAWLWFLLALFCLRVIGQMLVAFLGVSWLPPMEEWYSGLIPYPWLLMSQFLIILIYCRVCIEFTRGRGFFVVPRRALGSGLLSFGCIYLGAMVARYVIRMSLYPHERWLGGSIPIIFHCVLAGFLLVVGGYHWSRIRRATVERVWIESDSCMSSRSFGEAARDGEPCVLSKKAFR